MSTERTYRFGVGPENIPGAIEIEWSDIIGRLPTLEDEDQIEHITVLYRNNVLPWLTGKKYLPPIRTIFNAEFIGAPKSGKTTLLTNISTQMQLNGIPVNIHLEREIHTNPYFSDEQFNLALFLSSASRILDTSVNSSSD